METLTAFFTAINGFVWGPPMLVLILGTGLLLQVRLKLMPLLRIPTGFRMVWRGRTPDAGAEGEISPYAALMTALAATVGTGNIAGVATAIALGGPGALFWMWMTALVGMATKYSEVLLAVHFREVDDRGEHVGGPMFAIKNGLGAELALARRGVRDLRRPRRIRHRQHGAVEQHRRSGQRELRRVALDHRHRAGRRSPDSSCSAASSASARSPRSLVPAMCIGYIAASLIVLALYAGQIPSAFALIFHHAFNPVAATGGFAGATIMLAMRYGVARGIFSNEAGLGTAGIAQAAGQSASAAQSGLIGMMGTFIDTIIVCTMTGLVIIVTGVWNSGETGRGADARTPSGWPCRARRLLPRDRAGGLRLHHHPRLGLLRREVLGVSWWAARSRCRIACSGRSSCWSARSPNSTSSGWSPTR